MMVGDRNISIGYSNGTFTIIAYDAGNRVISMVSNPSSFQNFEYGYDNEGNELYEKENHHPAYSEQYQYDNANRLSNFKTGPLTGSVIPNPTTQTQYNYDGLGNRSNINVDGTITNYITNNLNQYTNIIGASNINLTYDLNGNLTYDGAYNFSYDNENRLVNINNGSIANYKYDALGRRIQKTLASQTVKYYYAGQNLIEEYNINDSLQASYVYGDGIDNIIAMRRDNNNYFYHKNALGSITSITSKSGTLVERYEYEAFGKPSIYDPSNNLLSTSEIANYIMFTGREFNNETNNYFYRARYYDCQMGRFSKRDPLGYKEGPNLYAYVENNPINFIDPKGTEITSCGVIAAGVASAFPSPCDALGPLASLLCRVGIGVGGYCIGEWICSPNPDPVPPAKPCLGRCHDTRPRFPKHNFDPNNKPNLDWINSPVPIGPEGSPVSDPQSPFYNPNPNAWDPYPNIY